MLLSINLPNVLHTIVWKWYFLQNYRLSLPRTRKESVPGFEMCTKNVIVQPFHALLNCFVYWAGCVWQWYKHTLCNRIVYQTGVKSMFINTCFVHNDLYIRPLSKRKKNIQLLNSEVQIYIKCIYFSVFRNVWLSLML